MSLLFVSVSEWSIVSASCTFQIPTLDAGQGFGELRELSTKVWRSMPRRLAEALALARLVHRGRGCALRGSSTTPFAILTGAVAPPTRREMEVATASSVSPRVDRRHVPPNIVRLFATPCENSSTDLDNTPATAKL